MSRESWKKVEYRDRIYLAVEDRIVVHAFSSTAAAARFCHHSPYHEVRWIELRHRPFIMSWIDLRSRSGRNYFNSWGEPFGIKWDGVQGCIDHTPSEDKS